MKFLVAGLGSIGRRHLQNLQALGEKDIILYRTHKSTMAEEALTGYLTFTNLEKALAEKPEAVIVSNPTALHMEIAIPAARAGCSLLLEKPISDDMKVIPSFVEAVRTGNGQVLVGFQFRFHPGLRKVKQLIDEGAVGEPIYVRAHWGEYLPGWHPWEDYRRGYAARTDLGGGVVRTLCHPFDYLRWLFGDVESLYASLINSGRLDIEVEDTAEVDLRFSSGVLGSVHLNYLQRPGVHNLEVVASRGSIRWDNESGAVSVFQTGENEAWQTYSPPTGFERNWLFVDELQHFIRMLSGDEQPVCSLKDGIEALRIVEAVYHSGKEQESIQLMAIFDPMENMENNT